MTANRELCIIVDDREHAIYGELSRSYPGETWYSKQRLKYGDFAIVASCDCLLAIIERKTIADYGASIRDGRHKNKDKIMELRGKSNCDLYYIIEGDFYGISDNSTFDGIPMSTIRSSVYNLAARDKIIPLIVADHSKSIYNLRGLLKSYTKHHKCQDCNVGSAGSIKYVADTPVINNEVVNRVIDGGAKEKVNATEQPAAQIIDKKDYQTLLNELPYNVIRKSILTTIPYITARLLPKLESYSIKDLCIDHVLDGDDGAALLTPKLAARFHINDALFEKMLSHIPNITKDTVRKIANELTIADLNDEKKLKIISKQAAEMIARIIKYKPVEE